MAENEKYKEIIFGVKDKNVEKEKLEQALKTAYKLRDFEINLYWQRSLYFVGFLAAIFVGFCKVKYEYLQIFLAMVGTIISFCWFLAIKGSKFWQENYEEHIYQLEKLNGTNILSVQFYKDEKGLLKADRYSVSEINAFIALVIMFSFLSLGLIRLFPYKYFILICSLSAPIVFIIDGIGLYYMTRLICFLTDKFNIFKKPRSMENFNEEVACRHLKLKNKTAKGEPK